MQPEEPGCISGCLGAIANGANDLLLLVSAQLGRTLSVLFGQNRMYFSTKTHRVRSHKPMKFWPMSAVLRATKGV
jgi:hypothetical protein